ncbi:EG45-like domain containing protein [Psilocybe cubensis]|uniref:RlpA-like protein double-psi beta-barrel domain-containing protein n=2 Tax=Psilocybe cubensis TaxID=181762 RepID=A0A8H8CK38_PSICU|nr:EG45-like domain containing protein [Psilocybe cubensis]KAH9476828.1 EG45-like domain containing protein [Psilocybe cubensis]
MRFSKTFFALVAAISGAAAFDGDATFFFPGLGACGLVNSDSDFIVALSTTQFQSGAKCGTVIPDEVNGQTVMAQVVDLCPGCAANDVDLSPAAFSGLASTDLGRIQVSWDFV